jgi:hypothetical protein
LIETSDEIGEVKGESEEHDKQGDLLEDTEKGKPILIVSPCMGGMPNTYQRFIRVHKTASL